MMQNEYNIETQSYEFKRDLSTLGNPIILALLSTLAITNFNNLFYFLFGLILVEIIGNSMKLIYFKDRPLKHEYKNLKEKLLSASFPSLHMARVTYFSLFFLRLDFPISYSILLMPIMVGYSRIVLKKHDFVDVLFGFLLGSILVVILK